MYEMIVKAPMVCREWYDNKTVHKNTEGSEDSSS